MSAKIYSKKTKYLIYAFVSLLAVIRIVIASKITLHTDGYNLSDAVNDDVLFLNYAHLKNHFLNNSYLPEFGLYNNNSFALLKTMVYPLFLNLVHISCLQYYVFLSLMWVGIAIFSIFVFKNLTKNKIILAFIYIYILFFPSFFDMWTGTKLYRNSLFAPFSFFLILLFLHILFKLKQTKRIKSIMVPLLILTIFFPFLYFLSEEGLQYLFVLIIFIASFIFLYIRQRVNNKNKRTVITKSFVFLLPLLSVLIFSNVYKAVNDHYFGVYCINTRTSCEYGKFISNVYKVKSDKRTPQVWAPDDAIKKVFSASDTLQKHTDILKNIETSSWLDGDISKQPITADFLTWILRESLINSNMWHSEKQVNDFFKLVNTELDVAFKNGTLEKDNKIQISKMTGGRSFTEIKNTIFSKENISLTIRSNLFFSEYKYRPIYDSDNKNSTLQAIKRLCTNTKTQQYNSNICDYAYFLTNRVNPTNFNGLTAEQFNDEQQQIELISHVIIKTYQIISIPITIIMCFVFLILIANLFVKKKIIKYVGSIDANLILFAFVALFVYSLISMFGISWFTTSFNLSEQPRWLQYYEAFISPIFSILKLISICILIKLCKTYILHIYKKLH
jgi:hypothetical protein